MRAEGDEAVLSEPCEAIEPDPGSQVVRVPRSKLASSVQEARRDVAEFAHAVTSVVQGMDPGIPVDDVVRILTEGHR